MRRAGRQSRGPYTGRVGSTNVWRTLLGPSLLDTQ